MIAARLLRLSAIPAALGAIPALAQDQPGPVQPRNGPGAVPPPLPAPAIPKASPFPAPAAAPTLRSSAPDVAVLITDVVIDGSSAAPVETAWTPVSDAATSLSLDPPPTTGFDAVWLKRQFVRNGLIGVRQPLDRTIALIQLVNIALVRNGNINSGIRIAGGEVIDGGVLRLELVLGHLVAPAGDAPISVRWGTGGAQGLTTGYIIHRMKAAAAVPLNAVAIERDFRLLAENPAIATVRADLRPGARPGEAVLALSVDAAPRFELYANIANSRSPAVGGLRGAVGGSIRNLIVAGDIASAEFGVTAFQPDLLASYQTPLLGTRTTLLVRGGYNLASVVDRPLVPLDISARDWNVEGGISQALIAKPLTPRTGGGWHAATSLSVGIRVTHRETQTFLLGQPFSFSPGTVNGRSDYTVLRLVADWTVRGIAQVTTVSLTLTQGLNGSRVVPTNADDAIQLLQRVPNPNFRSVLVQASHARRLTAKGLELRLRLTGQWADGLLYSGERLAAGGDYTVRGYRETLALVDRGVIGSVELYQPLSLSRRRANGRGFNPGAFGLSAFADGAFLRNAIDPQPRPDTLASVGGGVAWTPSPALTARITYGYAIFAAQQVGSRDLQDRGVQFRLTLRPLALFARQ